MIGTFSYLSDVAQMPLVLLFMRQKYLFFTTVIRTKDVVSAVFDIEDCIERRRIIVSHTIAQSLNYNSSLTWLKLSILCKYETSFLFTFFFISMTFNVLFVIFNSLILLIVFSWYPTFSTGGLITENK